MKIEEKNEKMLNDFLQATFQVIDENKYTINQFLAYLSESLISTCYEKGFSKEQFDLTCDMLKSKYHELKKNEP